MVRRNGKAGLYLLFLISGLIIGGIGGTEIVKLLGGSFNSRHEIAQAYVKQDISKEQTANTGSPVTDLADQRENAIVRATQKVSPCVVGIVVTQLQIVRHSYGSDEFFDFFFGPEVVPRVKEVERMGSGFIFSKEGYILTNFHVVEGAQKLFVTFPDGRKVEGEIIGVDPQTDLAVLKVATGDYPSVKLGNSDTLLIGEWAIAIGNPFGFFINDAHPSVTVGVISAVNRNFAPSEGVYYEGMIQTDAAINQGNSGGPLVNAKGEVIGINAFIFTGSDNYRGSIGIGFAIPIDRAKRVVKEIRSFGKRRSVYTGIAVQDLNRSIAASQGYGRTDGVVVSEIAKNSPGESAGLKRGDIVLQLGNRRIYSSGDIDGFFLDYFVGDSVTIYYFRNGKKLKTRITLAETRS